VDGAAGDLKPARLEAARVQEVVHHVLEAEGALQNELHRLLGLRGKGFLAQKLRQAQDGRQGRPELVGDGGEKLPLEPFRLEPGPEVAHVHHHPPDPGVL